MIIKIPSDYTGQVQVKFIEYFSINISWTPLSLPFGILVSNYIISYGLREGVKQELYLPPNETQKIISKLKRHKMYSFEVSAIILERDSSEHNLSLMISPTGGLDFFIPGEANVFYYSIHRETHYYVNINT